MLELAGSVDHGGDRRKEEFDVDLAAISVFVSVGDKRGFRAAAALGMTSPGISKAVARLEAQLGVTLVARTTRTVVVALARRSAREVPRPDELR